MFDQLMLMSKNVASLKSELRAANARVELPRDALPKQEDNLVSRVADFLPQDRLERLENASRVHTREFETVHRRISTMRIDRQIRIAPGYLLGKFRKKQPALVNMAPPKNENELVVKPPVKKESYDVVVMCPVYPGGMRPYGGEFIFKRVKAYAEAGLNVCVLEVNPKRKDEQDHKVSGVRVLRCGLDRTREFLSDSGHKTIAVHQLERPLWDVIKPFRTNIPITVWIHGFEARHWRELEGNYSQNDLKTLEKILDDVTEERKKTMSEVLLDPKVKKIFVSDFMKGVTEKFTEQSAKNVHVIHNQILKSDFPYVPKTAKDRLSILWVRSFGAFNYSNDLSRDAILELSKRPYFNDLRFTIYGDGKLFEECTDPLKQFSNVSINRQFIPTEKLRDLHGEHGIMLVPSRWDSQGLTCGEAMSAGLVPITNRVAALPEFVDDTCGYLCWPNDAISLANAIEDCYQNPSKFLKKSKRATKRSQSQCGKEKTIVKEIKLIRAQLKG